MMMIKVFLAEGKRVRNPEDPNYAPLLEGVVYNVPANNYWARRIIAKEVKMAPAESKMQPQKVEEEKKEAEKPSKARRNKKEF